MSRSVARHGDDKAPCHQHALRQTQAPAHKHNSERCEFYGVLHGLSADDFGYSEKRAIDPAMDSMQFAAGY